jgi:hypothetical protein
METWSLLGARNGEVFRAHTVYQRENHAKFGQHAIEQMVKHLRYIQSIDEVNERGSVSTRSSQEKHIQRTYGL